MQPWSNSCVALALLAAQAGAAHAADELVVEAERNGERIDVRAQAVIAAPRDLVWEALTDYEGLPRFIPGISRSVVRLRQGNRLLLEQAGEARFLIFSLPIQVSLEVLESPRERISSRAVAGNLRRMNGRYEIQPGASPGTVLLRYSGEIEPDFELPPLIGMFTLRTSAEQQFMAMVEEIERRAAAAGR